MCNKYISGEFQFHFYTVVDVQPSPAQVPQPTGAPMDPYTAFQFVASGQCFFVDLHKELGQRLIADKCMMPSRKQVSSSPWIYAVN